MEYNFDGYILTKYRLRKIDELTEYEKSTGKEYYWFRLLNKETNNIIWISSIDYDFKTIEDTYKTSTTYYNIYNESLYKMNYEYKIFLRTLKLKKIKSK